MSYLLVFLGGGLGSVLRLVVNRAATAVLGGSPFGTLLVNVIGSYAMGLLAASLLARGVGEHPVRLFLATGVLGGFTTFSAFSLDAGLLWQRGKWGGFALYVGGSVLRTVSACMDLQRTRERDSRNGSRKGAKARKQKKIGFTRRRGDAELACPGAASRPPRKRHGPASSTGNEGRWRGAQPFSAPPREQKLSSRLRAFA